eukprot:190899-Chlamydomonas_euryale.AAC.7
MLWASYGQHFTLFIMRNMGSTPSRSNARCSHAGPGTRSMSRAALPSLWPRTFAHVCTTPRGEELPPMRRVVGPLTPCALTPWLPAICCHAM